MLICEQELGELTMGCLPVGKELSSSSVMEGIPFHIESWMQTEPTLQHCRDQVKHTWMGM